MILFRKEHVKPILEGRKTQTRRIWKKCRVKIGSIHQVKVGFKKNDTFARIKITSARKEKLGLITEDDAKREGYNSIEEYKRVFEWIYGKWNPEVEVWVVDFEVAAGD